MEKNRIPIGWFSALSNKALNVIVISSGIEDHPLPSKHSAVLHFRYSEPAIIPEKIGGAVAFFRLEGDMKERDFQKFDSLIKLWQADKNKVGQKAEYPEGCKISLWSENQGELDLLPRGCCVSVEFEGLDRIKSFCSEKLQEIGLLADKSFKTFIDTTKIQIQSMAKDNARAIAKDIAQYLGCSLGEEISFNQINYFSRQAESVSFFMNCSEAKPSRNAIINSPLEKSYAMCIPSSNNVHQVFARNTDVVTDIRADKKRFIQSKTNFKLTPYANEYQHISPKNENAVIMTPLAHYVKQ
jgi:hypothetical protein